MVKATATPAELKTLESEEVAHAREYAGRTLTQTLENLQEGRYQEARTSFGEKGDLSVREVTDLIAAIGEIGLDNFDSFEGGLEEKDYVTVFYHTDKRGFRYEIQCAVPSYVKPEEDNGNHVVRELYISVGPSQEINNASPRRVLNIINTEDQTGYSIESSVLVYRSFMFIDRESSRPPYNPDGSIERQLRLVNLEQNLQIDR